MQFPEIHKNMTEYQFALNEESGCEHSASNISVNLQGMKRRQLPKRRGNRTSQLILIQTSAKEARHITNHLLCVLLSSYSVPRADNSLMDSGIVPAKEFLLRSLKKEKPDISNNE
jgi:hypothetical protein